jgi:pSer/pThr/pTyr-binding forkhead associated (FHA) protein
MPRITIAVPGKIAQPYAFPLDCESVTLGRGSENDIVIESGSVSVQHAEMRRTANGYELIDRGSTNGLKVADQCYEALLLENGSEVLLGDVSFYFMLGAGEIEALAPELPAAFIDEKQPYVASVAPARGLSFAALLLLAMFMAVAFAVGLAVRYQKDTGKILVQQLQQKFLAPGPVVLPASR